MKNTIRSTALSFLLIAASIAYGGVPTLNVTVSDPSGKGAYNGRTNANGVFATANLKPGNYVVQFNSKSGAVKGTTYSIVVSAGKKKVAANAVPGEKFAGGGVAMKVEVGAGLNITGQVAEESKGAMKNGKKMVWVPPMLGSNMPGRWVEEGSAEAVASKARGNIRTENVQSMQDNASNPGGN